MKGKSRWTKATVFCVTKCYAHLIKKPQEQSVALVLAKSASLDCSVMTFLLMCLRLFGQEAFFSGSVPFSNSKKHRLNRKTKYLQKRSNYFRRRRIPFIDQKK